MNDLIKVNYDGENPVVSGRELHEFLEVKDHYTEWFKRMVEYGFAESVDFVVFQISRNDDTAFGGVRKTADHAITLGMAKEISMIQRTKKGKQARQYFIKCEEKLNEVAAEKAIDASKLSPQMRLLTEMVTSMAQQELKTKEIEAKLHITQQETAEVRQSLEVVKDTIINRDNDWRKSINKMFNNAVQNSGTKDFQAFRNETYKLLEARAGCNLTQRLINLKERMMAQGSTKSQIERVTRLDIIENDKKLKEIYTTIIKEMSIRYSA